MDGNDATCHYNLQNGDFLVYNLKDRYNISHVKISSDKESQFKVFLSQEETNLCNTGTVLNATVQFNMTGCNNLKRRFVRINSLRNDSSICAVMFYRKYLFIYFLVLELHILLERLGTFKKQTILRF